MKVMVIVKASKDSEADVMPSEKLLTEMGQYNEELAKAGILLAGEGLHPSSKGVRLRFSGDSRVTIDGPFAETKELIAGYWLWKVDSMEQAIEWLKRCPNPHEEECEVEIRPVFSAEDFGDEFTPALREQEAAIRARALGLEAPRFEDCPAMRFTGINESYTPETRAGIPGQWDQFAPHIGNIPGQQGNAAYGVCWNSKPGCLFDYLACVETKGNAEPGPGFTQLEVAPRRYTIFPHTGPVNEIPKTIETIWMKWVPEASLKIAEAPCFERYGEEFDPNTGLGGMEIYVPLDA